MANKKEGIARRIVGNVGTAAAGTAKGAAKSVVSAANPLNILRAGGGAVGNTAANVIDNIIGNVGDAIRETKRAQEQAKRATDEQTDEQKKTNEELERLREQLKDQQNQDRELFGKASTGVLAQILGSIDFGNEILFEIANAQSEQAELQREKQFSEIENQREKLRREKAFKKDREKEKDKDGVRAPTSPIAKIFGGLGNVFAPLVDSLDEFFLFLFGTKLLGRGASAAGGAAKGAGLLGKLGGLAKTLGKASVVVGVLVDGINGLFNAETFGVSKLSAVIGTILGGSFENKIINSFAQAGQFALIGAGLASIGGPIGIVAGGAIGAVIGTIMGVIGPEKISKFVDSIGGFVADSFSQIKSGFMFLMDGILTSIDVFFDFFGIDIFKTLNDTVDYFRNSFIPDFKRGIGVVQGWLNSAWNTLSDLTSSAVSFATETAVSIKNDFVRGLGVIRQSLSGVGEKIKEAGEFTREKIEEIVGKERLDRFLTNFEKGIGRIGEFLTSIPDKLMGFIDRAIPDFLKPTKGDATTFQKTKALEANIIKAGQFKSAAAKAVVEELNQLNRLAAAERITPEQERKLRQEIKSRNQKRIAQRRAGVKVDPAIDLRTGKPIAQQNSVSIPSAGSVSSGNATGSIAQPSETFSGDKVRTRIAQNEGERIMRAALDAAGITDPTERAAFLAQMSHESMGFTRMSEIGGGSRYEGRRDLGNVQPGDGERYKGRGFIQLTGRSNYRMFGQAIGVDLENNPQMAADPNIAARVAIAYWNQRVKPRVSDFRNTEAITKAINGGFNGLQDRKRRFARFMQEMNSGTQLAKADLSGGESAGPMTSFLPQQNKNVTPPTNSGDFKSATGNTAADLQSQLASIDGAEIVKSKMGLLDTIEANLGLKSAKSVKQATSAGRNNVNSVSQKNVNAPKTTINQQGLRHQESTMQRTTDSQFVG